MELLSGPELAIALLVVAAGAVVQGSIGFGFVLTSAPIIGLMRPESLPGTFILLATPMAIWMAFRERGAIDVPGFVQLTVGRVLGTAIAGYVLAVIAEDALALLAGAAILVAVLLSAVASGFEAGRKGRLLAGVVSGVMGTVGAVGGPASALAYQKRSGAEIRSTLAASFVTGTLMSLVALTLADKLDSSHWQLALLLTPGTILGLAFSGRVIHALDGRWLRPAVLLFAGIGGISLVWKGL